MAAIRHIIQKEVFTPLDERMVGIVNVTKPGRKKKSSFLCIAVNQQEQPPLVHISRVKSLEKRDRQDRESYRRVKTWRLADLRLVDGRSAETEVPEFDLHFDKNTFKWIASSVVEKKAFVTCLYKLVHKYVERKKPEFVNVDEGRLQGLLLSVEPKSRASGIEDEEEVLQQEEYQELTEQEEKDLEDLLLRENAIQDAPAFMENLSEELAQLDQGNIHSLMGSETQIRELMGHLDQAVLEVEQMEMKLTVYDELLSGVRDTMQKMGKQYTRILVENRNLRALHTEVEDLVNKLDLDPAVERILRESPLSGTAAIRDCTGAAQTLQEVINHELSQGISILQAVTEQKQFFASLSFTFGRRLHEHLSSTFVGQKQFFASLSFTFGRRLHEHLSSTFVGQAAEMLDAVQVRHVSVPSINSHNAVHTDLLPYSALMKWLRDCEPLRFSDVMESYIRSFRRVYEDEVKAFMMDIKGGLLRGMEARKPGFLAKMGSNADIQRSLAAIRPLAGSLMALSPSSRGGGVSQSVADFSSSGSYGSPEHANRPKFHQAFTHLLDQLQPVSLSEQRFLTSFFHFQRPEHPTTTLDQGPEEEIDGKISPLHRRQQPSPMLDIGDSASGGLQGVLGQLFSVLLQEIESFITFGDRLDNYNALFVLVTVSQRLVEAEESGAVSYLDETLMRALVFVRRLFDKFITSKKRAIEETKVSRGGKCGVLPCVEIFSRFAEQAESIVMAMDRRADLDKAYLILIDAVFRTIERAAREHPKTPPDVIKFENYKRMLDILSRHKVSCLEQRKEEAKRKDRTHRQDYVKHCLGRPLEKLSLFFEGVETLIAAGTKAEEVGFRLDYSRSELRKCIKEYPGKEVKRGLEKLYRRIEKEVSDEAQSVIWGAMQEAFIGQFQRFQELIGKCYPGSNINLEFTLEDLIEYFSSISQQR